MNKSTPNLSEMNIEEVKNYVLGRIPDISKEVQKRHMTYLIGKTQRAFDSRGNLNWSDWVQVYNKALNQGMSPEDMIHYTKSILRDVYNRYILSYVFQFVNDPIRQHIEAYELLMFFSNEWGVIEEPIDSDFPSGLAKPQVQPV